MSLQEDKNNYLLRMLSALLKALDIFSQVFFFERHCHDVHSLPLMREHHDSYLY